MEDIQKDNPVRVGKDHPRYVTALKFINKILVNLGKEEVDDLTKFVDIDREDILKGVNKASYTEMYHELFPLFTRAKCGYEANPETMLISCLRGMMKQMGYAFVYRRRETPIRVNGKAYRKKCTFYSIK
jgi:hypothetical protein